MLLHPQTVSHRTGAYVSSNDDAPHSRVITHKWEEEGASVSSEEEASSDEYDDYEAFNPGVEDPITDYKGKFGVISIKKIAAKLGMRNMFDAQSVFETHVPVAKALNISKLNRTELTRLWLARLGQPDLSMLRRMRTRNRAFGAEKILSVLNEDKWIQAKGNFRMKSYKREDSLERCLPDEKPWDTILVNEHGPMQVPSIQGATYAYYFRSRKGGGIIVKGASAHSQFPHGEVNLRLRSAGAPYFSHGSGGFWYTYSLT